MVAAFNIISGLIMLVKDKGREIGILRTMGASKGAIMRVFLITGASIGVVGTLAGAVLGILFCWRIDEIRQFVAWLTNTNLFNPEIYYLTGCPPTSMRTPPASSSSWRWCCRCWRRSIPPGAPRGSIPSKRCATSERGEARSKRQCRTPPPAPCCSCRRSRRTFRQGDREIPVLKGASAALYPGQAVALVGPSGAGKSTLLHIAGLLETPDGGRVIVNGADCSRLGDTERTRVRRIEMGFVYQFHQLLPEFSALENVRDAADDPRRRRARPARRAPSSCSSMLGLGERLDHRPAQLSGGEQQRTAIARALANAPKLLLADEPTGNLDPTTSAHVFHELLELIQHTGVAALIATHNLDARPAHAPRAAPRARRADRDQSGRDRLKTVREPFGSLRR